MIDKAFLWCVHFLERLAAKLGTTYNAVNVWIFCIIWPLITLALIVTVIAMALGLHRGK